MGLIYTVAVFIVLLCSSTAAAHTLAAIRQNCDLRVLQMNAVQKQQLQLLRREFKQRQNNTSQQSIRSESTALRLNMLMANPAFDTEAARRIVLDSHQNELSEQLDELHFYHRLYHILTPAQQQTWLQTCVRR